MDRIQVVIPYNATTKALTLIYDGNGDSGAGSNLFTEQCTVSEISSTKLNYYYKYGGNERA